MKKTTETQNTIKKIDLKYITSQGFSQDKKKKSQVRVMIPKNTFFTIHPKNQVKAPVAYHDGHWYLFGYDIADYYYGRLKKLSTATLYQGITEDGQSFIIPVVEPWPGYSGTWHDSLICRVEDARKCYMKIDREDNISCYSMVEKKRLSTNVKWPKQNFEELLALAFPDDYYVVHNGNPVFEDLLMSNASRY